MFCNFRFSIFAFDALQQQQLQQQQQAHSFRMPQQQHNRNGAWNAAAPPTFCNSLFPLPRIVFLNDVDTIQVVY